MQPMRNPSPSLKAPQYSIGRLGDGFDGYKNPYLTAVAVGVILISVLAVSLLTEADTHN